VKVSEFYLLREKGKGARQEAQTSISLCFVKFLRGGRGREGYGLGKQDGRAVSGRQAEGQPADLD
jgi:hypothetical protein